jgi:hypothetical protein
MSFLHQREGRGSSSSCLRGNTRGVQRERPPEPRRGGERKDARRGGAARLPGREGAHSLAGEGEDDWGMAGVWRSAPPASGSMEREDGGAGLVLVVDMEYEI